ncbi:MAG: hypothetical protein J0M18_14075 [Ignavibacteria bacterium]|nr:hypothetical protein [Ignavibacteria bacterium]
MKKLILLFLLVTSAVFAQKDEIYGIKKVTVSLLGYRQAVPSDIYQKNFIVDNTAGNNTVYFCMKQNGIVDTVNSIPVSAGNEKTFFNFTSDTIYVKGTSGQSVDIYILMGTGRGVLKSPGSSSNGVQYNDSLTKYSTPAQVNTALASYYTKTQIDTGSIARINQNESVTGRWVYADLIIFQDSLGLPTGYILLKNGNGVRYNKSFTVTDTVYASVINSTGRVLSGADVIANAFTSTTGGGYKATAGGIFYFDTRSVIKSPSDGTITFTNNAETTNATLVFGTATVNLLPTYADNAAALSGGLTAGKLYRTSTGVVMVTY